MFPVLEKLYLSYNQIPVSHLQNLKYLGSLQELDLAANDLVTLPDDMSFLINVENLNLSSNQFNSESTIVKPDTLFKAMGSIPKLKRLNISRNKFGAIHSEMLNENSFISLQELDVSYNVVIDQDDLMWSKNI